MSTAPATRPSRVLRLPDRGRLLVCTDLHGNLGDFQRMVALFEQLREQEADPFLLFTGDLIHGPDVEAEADWPDYLGAYYRDQSGELVEQYLELERRFPGRVGCLIGNHEHSHVGGPHTPKFWEDETAHFEEVVGPERTARYRELFRRMPLVAVSAAGISVTHGAPNAALTSVDELEVDYDGYEEIDINAMYSGSPLARILWSRACKPEIAAAFRAALSRAYEPQSIVVFGHDIVHEGYERIGADQLQLSSSFGVPTSCKYYLDVDLARRYTNVEQLADGRELRQLYPSDDNAAGREPATNA